MRPSCRAIGVVAGRHGRHDREAGRFDDRDLTGAGGGGEDAPQLRHGRDAMRPRDIRNIADHRAGLSTEDGHHARSEVRHVQAMALVVRTLVLES